MALAVLPGVLWLSVIWDRFSMIDWNLASRIAGGGFGVTILVLVILSLVAWIMGLIIRKTTKTTTEGKEIPAKDK